MNPAPAPLDLLDTELSDEAAAQLVEVLRELTDLLESRYYAQIRRYYQADHHNRQTENWDDHNPPF
jgi:hypothetical protein